MTDTEFERKQDELDRLLNDPETPMHADQVWALAERLASFGRDTNERVGAAASAR